MDYDGSSDSGTNDDLPSSHQNRGVRGRRITANERAISDPHLRVRIDMESQIHWLEQDAYAAVLRAFKAQSDAISWDKASLITELRKELRISDEEHRQLLSSVDTDDVIRKIREWRLQNPRRSPTVSASQKRKKTSQSLGVFSGGKGQVLQCETSMQSLPYPSTYPSTGPSGRDQFINRNSAELAEDASYASLIGRKVMTRWPEDNNFYEAVITKYNPHEGNHALVYDIHTNNETWEWVNLKEISPDDIRWIGDDPGFVHHPNGGGSGRGLRKFRGRGGAILGTGRGRGLLMNQPNNNVLTQSGDGIHCYDEIKMLDIETLTKEVDRVLGSSYLDPLELKRMKGALKEREQSLIDAISRLEDTSNVNNERERDQLKHGHFLNPETVAEEHEVLGADDGLR